MSARGIRGIAAASFFAALLAGCSQTASVDGVTTTSAAFAPNKPLRVCSGYGCIITDRFSLNDTDVEELHTIMAPGAASPEAEREAIAEAIGWFERIARQRLGYRRDVEKAYQVNARKRGQMDCVDESLNTTGYLQFVASQGLLKHHRVRKRFASRGLLVDGRYPHKSAVIIETGGRSWSVDSWYEPDGVKPKVMPLKAWKKVRDSFG